jgi:uncharacterized protein (DUF427 family)
VAQHTFVAASHVLLPIPRCDHMTVQAVWNGQVIAESDETVVIEGNHYFPRSSVIEAYLRPSATTSVCPWKGTASYHTVVVDGKENPDAAWYYPTPKPSADVITGRVAFWRGVKVRKVEAPIEPTTTTTTS